MVFDFFKKKNKTESQMQLPEIMGLHLGGSFEVDSLLLRLIDDKLVTNGIAPTQIIEAAGLVELDGNFIFRFYTDDDAFLQVVADGGKTENDVIDVKLFHFFSTDAINSQSTWDQLLEHDMGGGEYQFEGNSYRRVWESLDSRHPPVHMHETTYADLGKDVSNTDQFTMLYERVISDELVESLFLSAEEKMVSDTQLDRCLVISTGISLMPSQLTIQG